VGKAEGIGFTLAMEAVEQEAGMLQVDAAPEIFGRMPGLSQKKGGHRLPPS
jgi:hypothetical protein